MKFARSPQFKLWCLHILIGSTRYFTFRLSLDCFTPCIFGLELGQVFADDWAGVNDVTWRWNSLSQQNNPSLLSCYSISPGPTHGMSLFFVEGHSLWTETLLFNFFLIVPFGLAQISFSHYENMGYGAQIHEYITKYKLQRTMPYRVLWAPGGLSEDFLTCRKRREATIAVKAWLFAHLLIARMTGNWERCIARADGYVAGRAPSFMVQCPALAHFSLADPRRAAFLPE